MFCAELRTPMAALAAAAALLTTLRPASGQMTFVSRTTTLNTMASGPGSSDGDADGTTGFEPFDRSIASSAFRGNAEASQSSALSPTSITWSTAVSAWSMFGSPQTGGSGFGSAHTTLEVVFILERDSPVTLSGTQWFPGESFAGTVTLALYQYRPADGETTVFALVHDPAFPVVQPFSFSGVLAAGTYRLFFDSSIIAGGGAFRDLEGSGLLTITPVPGTAFVVLLAGGFAGVHRRRRI